MWGNIFAGQLQAVAKQPLRLIIVPLPVLSSATVTNHGKPPPLGFNTTAAEVVLTHLEELRHRGSEIAFLLFGKLWSLSICK